MKYYRWLFLLWILSVFVDLCAGFVVRNGQLLHLKYYVQIGAFVIYAMAAIFALFETWYHVYKKGFGNEHELMGWAILIFFGVAASVTAINIPLLQWWAILPAVVAAAQGLLAYGILFPKK